MDSVFSQLYCTATVYTCTKRRALLFMQPVGQALIFTLSKGLEDKFTKEVETAWVTLYTTVQHFMSLGMAEGL